MFLILAFCSSNRHVYSLQTLQGPRMAMITPREMPQVSGLSSLKYASERIHRHDHRKTEKQWHAITITNDCICQFTEQSRARTSQPNRARWLLLNQFLSGLCFTVYGNCRPKSSPTLFAQANRKFNFLQEMQSLNWTLYRLHLLFSLDYNSMNEGAQQHQ